MPGLEKVLRYLIIGGVFLLPFTGLIVIDSLFFPFITGKNFYFRIVVELITAAWLALALVYPQYRPRRSWLLGAFALFVVVMAVADAHGVVPFKSFWSNFERMDGWVTLAHLLAYLVVVASVMQAEQLWRWLFRVSLAISGFLAVYGFLQIAGDIAVGNGTSSGLSARIDATFGNPIYFAVYMLFHIFIAALLWADTWRRRSGARLAPSLMYGALIAIDTLALFFTGTRGTMLGLFGGAALALLIYAFAPQASRTFKRATIGVFLVGAVLGGSLWIARDTAFVKHVGFLDRLASISLADGTVNARFLNMGIAWQGVKERPILGWGQADYAIVFDKYYDPRMYAQEQWFDRVHNSIFDWWIAGGTLGLLAYLAIFAAVLWVLWRGGYKDERAFTNAERAILTGLLAGYFFHNLTVFDNVVSYILFATMLGYILWRAGSAYDAPRLLAQTRMPDGSLAFTAVVAALIACGSIWWINAAAYAQNRALIHAIQAPASGDLNENLAAFTQAIAYGAYGTQEAREQLVQMASRVITASSSQIDDATKQAYFNEATAQMKAQEAASPLDARFPLFLGLLYQTAGDYADAEAALTHAHELSPRKQSILIPLAQNEEAQGHDQQALATLRTAYELDTEDEDARIYYAALAIKLQQDALADELLAPIVASGDAADPRITSAYLNRGETDKAVVLWKAYVQAHPSDTKGYLTLAALYYKAGKSAPSIAVLQQLLSVDPSLKDQVESLIQEVRSGTAQVQ